MTLTFHGAGAPGGWAPPGSEVSPQRSSVSAARVCPRTLASHGGSGQQKDARDLVVRRCLFLTSNKTKEKQKRNQNSTSPGLCCESDPLRVSTSHLTGIDWQIPALGHRHLCCW